MSNAMPERNKPCPCGSGVKFKRCCGFGDGWVPGLGWVPTFARRRATEDRMVSDVAENPALLESPTWRRFCVAERAAENSALDAAVDGWEIVFFDAERHPWIDYTELAEGIARAHIGFERWDRAIEWLEREGALRRERFGEPAAWGNRRDIADVLVRADRTKEAERIFDDNRAATPEDIWVYNGAALSWLYSGHDAAAALPWIEEGLALARRTGDPERLLGQLEDLKREALGG